MKRPLKIASICISACLSISPLAAQTIPAGLGSVPNLGFQLPRLGGSYSYALNASEMVSTGYYNNGTAFTTNFGGDLAYMSTSISHPFSIVYAGGVLIGNSDQPTTTYQDLSLSQVFKTKNWNFEAQDAVSYMPESPVSGLSGIPGVGDLGIDPVPIGPISGIGVLTTYGPRVSNTVTGSAGRLITARISAQASGYYSVQRFIGDNADFGVDNNSEGGSAGVSYHFNPLSTLTVSYNYTKFDYIGTAFSYTAQGGTVDYARQWNRRFSTDAYIGPQYISSPASASLYGSLPSSVQIQGGASAGFSARTLAYTFSYSRGANNGSGVLPGSFADNVVAAAHRQFGRVWNVSAALDYSRTSSLPIFTGYTFRSDGESVSGQASRLFGRRIAGYASYTVEHQSTSGFAPEQNAFSGVYQVFAFGVSYSPGSIPLGK